MTGRQTFQTVVVASLFVGCFVGALYYPIATSELVWETGQWGVLAHEPRQPLGGFTNDGDHAITIELRVADTNASIYIMSPEEWNRTLNGHLTYDAARSFDRVTNASVTVELPSNYAAWIYAGESTDGSVYEVKRELQRPGAFEVLLVGLGAFSVALVFTTTIMMLLRRRG